MVTMWEVFGKLWVHLDSPTSDWCGWHPGNSGYYWVFPLGSHVNAGCKSVEIPLGTHIDIPYGTNVGSIREVMGASGFAHVGLMWVAPGYLWAFLGFPTRDPCECWVQKC